MSEGQSQGWKVLLVEDDPSEREACAEYLRLDGFDVIEAKDAAEAEAKLHDGVAVIVTDLKLPGMDGLELLKRAKQEAPHAAVIMVTGQGSEQAAVAALKAGAFDYLTKPVNPAELSHAVRQALEKAVMAVEIAKLHAQLNEKYGFENLIGISEPMRRVFEKIRLIADTRSTVLIEGESGTGKELVARAIHYNSSRRNKPFVAINCAAIPETLVESELFGYERGAFTGATERRIGKFQAAHGGTLLIDEVSEMPLPLQSKFLRVIETRRITPIGSVREIEVDVRIIAATNRNLKQAVEEGKFREDLYYRLNVVNIKLPPLRERREDIPLLVRHFIDEIARENNRPVRDITPQALAKLKAYDWPGNVRELRNTLESIIVLSTKEVIDVDDLPEHIRGVEEKAAGAADLLSGNMTMEQIEREAIRRALEQCNGSRVKAAKMLGLSVRTLQRKIKRYQLPF